MMYILYNSDGSVLKKNLTDFIQKGNNNVNSIFVAIDGYENNEWNLSAVFELPDGTLTSGTPTTDTKTIDGDSYSGWLVNISAAVTIYEGILKLSLQAQDNEVTPTTLFTSEVKLVINPTVSQPNETNITYAQYLELLTYINQQIGLIDIASYVPYSGATADVDLGNHGLESQSFTTDTIYLKDRDNEGQEIEISVNTSLTLAHNGYSKSYEFDFSNNYPVISYGSYTYTFPSASGTLATQDYVKTNALIDLGTLAATTTIGQLRALMTKRGLYSFVVTDGVNINTYIGYATTSGGQTSLSIVSIEGSLGFKRRWEIFYQGNQDSVTLADLLTTTSTYYKPLATQSYVDTEIAGIDLTKVYKHKIVITHPDISVTNQVQLTVYSISNTPVSSLATFKTLLDPNTCSWMGTYPGYYGTGVNISRFWFDYNFYLYLFYISHSTLTESITYQLDLTNATAFSDVVTEE